MQLPAYCENCNLLFSSAIPMVPGIQATNNRQSCPKCGSLANIADFANGIARLYPKNILNQKSLLGTLTNLTENVDQLLTESKNRNESFQNHLDQVLQEKTGVKGFFSQLFHRSKNLKHWVRRYGWKKLLVTITAAFMLVANDDISELVDFDFNFEPIIIQLPKHEDNEIETFRI